MKKILILSSLFSLFVVEAVNARNRAHTATVEEKSAAINKCVEDGNKIFNCDRLNLWKKYL